METEVSKKELIELYKFFVREMMIVRSLKKITHKLNAAMITCTIINIFYFLSQNIN